MRCHGTSKSTAVSLGLCSLVAQFYPSLARAQYHSVECPSTAREIEEIRFIGSKHTQDKVLLREMQIQAGDRATAEQLHADAARLRDLGLFRQVGVSCAEDTRGLIAEFTMREKYYLIVAPRSDGNSDGDYSYGMHMSWHNAFGLNHTWRATALQRQSTQTGRGDSFEYRVANTMPFIFDSPYTASWGMAHETATLEPEGLGSYEQSDDKLSLHLARHFSDGAATQGLTLGLGYEMRNREALEPEVMPDLGVAHSAILSASYRQRHNQIYSDTGFQFQAAVSHANENLGSDYNQTTLALSLDQDWHVGKTAFQTVGIHFESEMQHGGPPDGLNQYSLGGARLLRGYPRNVAEGDAYAMLRFEAYRPLFWRWLRWGGFLETGAAWGGQEAHNPGLLASAGIGFQIHPTWFVGMVIDIGFGIPLIAQDEPGTAKFYGSGR